MSDVGDGDDSAVAAGDVAVVAVGDDVGGEGGGGVWIAVVGAGESMALLESSDDLTTSNKDAILASSHHMPQSSPTYTQTHSISISPHTLSCCYRCGC